MANKMIIDAAHPEETRVVVLRGNRVEEFDFEAANKKQLRGNIYLAKVTRVEPSLQAAFIEYGGNRHGFLAFSEIHPDYYQIPVADRQALLDEEARTQEDEEEESRSSSNGHRRSRRHRRGDRPASAEKRSSQNGESISEPLAASEDHGSTDPQDQAAPFDSNPFAEETGAPDPIAVRADEPSEEGAENRETTDQGEAAAGNAFEAPSEMAEMFEFTAESDDVVPLAANESGEGSGHNDAEEREDDDRGEDVTTLEHGYEAAHEPTGRDASQDSERDTGSRSENEEDGVEQLGGDALEDVPHRVARPRRHYKIQEVIKRRQVLLVQVVKEERGNKGAALTTYLSLAGRYSVLMPNTARGGGISRKITDAEDRKRLKAIAQELEVPEGMGIILRTAGAARGMPEVKRDFEYLMRMWETVRETTLQSTAPTLVYEEGSLIKRSIRDLYGKEVDEVVVAGDEGYREARDFMRLLMPGHTKNVIAYRDPQPIFAKSGVEAQLDAMFSNQVVLRSGGYLVINQTEALVAIDVNSGRSTREHNIEDTALRTNLEAADEIARQLRLRDLAGLIVVDFIDMEEGRNDRAVERRIKDALKNDRARIQIGRISHFGLLEMSRQRMRTGVLEGSTVMCPHCAGSGTVRSVSSIALHVLRLLEDALIKSAAYNLSVRTQPDVALYILNQKRANLLDLETRFGVCINVFSDPLMTGTVYHAIDRGMEATPPQLPAYRFDAARVSAPVVEEDEEDLDALALDEGEDEGQEDEAATDASPVQAREGQSGERGEGEGEGSRRRKRRRRRRGRDNQNQYAAADGQQPSDTGPEEPGALEGDQNETTFDPETSDEALFEPEPAEDTRLASVETAPELEAAGHGIEASSVEIEAEAAEEPSVIEAALPASMAEELPPAVEEVSAIAAAAPAAKAIVAAGESTPTESVAGVEAEPVASAESEPVVSEAPRRKRTRRTRATETAPGEAAPVLEALVEPVEEVVAPVRRPRRSRARPVEATLPLDIAPPSADRDVGADTVVHHPARVEEAREPELPLTAAAPVAVSQIQPVEVAPSFETVETAAAAEAPASASPLEGASPAEAPSAETSPEPESTSEADVDPNRPKRSGWWQRAKSTFTS